MKLHTLILLSATLGLAGCNTFEENMHEDEMATTTQGMNEKEEAQVQEFSDGGQLNEYEQQQMEESIGGSGNVDSMGSMHEQNF